MNLSIQLQRNKEYDNNLSKSLNSYPSDPLLLSEEERNLIESVKIQDRLQYTLTQKILNLNNEIESFKKRLFSLGPNNV